MGALLRHCKKPKIIIDTIKWSGAAHQFSSIGYDTADYMGTLTFSVMDCPFPLHSHEGTKRKKKQCLPIIVLSLKSHEYKDICVNMWSVVEVVI